MTGTQKIIKYSALALAAVLVVSIFSGIYSVGSVIFGIADNFDSRGTDSGITAKEFIPQEEIEQLYIDVFAAHVSVKLGDALTVQTDSEYITFTETDRRLEIREKKHNFIGNNVLGELVLTLPKGCFDQTEINTGAGSINVEYLETKTLSMELGAGEVNLSGLNVTENCKISGGAGKINLTSTTISNLELDMGIGELNMTAELSGDNAVNCGVGEVKLTLLGNKENYTVDIDKGIGSATVDGNALSGGNIYGNGSNKLQIDGGIGSITINFAEGNNNEDSIHF